VELSWTTFVLEIINFVVLVWILKRFLYKPVLNVIASRQAGIEKSVAEAKTLRAEAEKLQEQYEGRLADWDRERQQARESLSRDIDAERARKMEELQTALQQENEKARVKEEHRQADVRRRIEETALQNGARFATRLLEQASGPDLEKRLVEILLTELSQLPDEQITALRKLSGATPENIVVTSAFPLEDEQRQRIEQALKTMTDAEVSAQYKQNSELVAGVQITVGDWVLAANIRDELRGFIQLNQYE
jgi:F-type H+-transporting ATPase subunit b